MDVSLSHLCIFLHSFLQIALNVEHKPDMFTGDKAEVINPNRVHEGLNKGAFVCWRV